MKNSTKQNVTNGFNFRTLFLMFTVGILPLIVFTYIGDTADYKKYPWFDDGEYFGDLFYHCKCTWFSIIAVIMLVGIVDKLIRMSKEERKGLFKRYWPMFGYFACIVVSFIFAIEQRIAFVGGNEQMEPVLVLVGYSLLSIYIFLNIKTIKEVKLVLYAFLFGTFVIVLIGVLQIFGVTVYALPVFRRFIMNSADYAAGNTFHMNGAIISTFGNSNYLGVYTCFTIPFTISIFFSKCDYRARILAAVDALGLIVLLYFSRSKAGMITVLGVAVIAVIFMGRNVITKWKIYVPIIVVTAGLFLLLDSGRDWYIIGRLGRMLKIEKREYALTEIDTTGDDLRIVYKGSELHFLVEEEDGYYYAEGFENGEKMEVTQGTDEEDFDFVMKSGERIPTMFYAYTDGIEFYIRLDDHLFGFQWDTELTNVMMLNPSHILDESIVSHNFLDGYEYIATDRGYIWGIAIPRLKNYLIVGAGPDNFPFGVFLDGIDYANRYSSGCWEIYYTRPHNYYLQMGIDTGVLSLVLCLIFFVWYLVDCCKLYFWKKPDSSEFVLGFCSMLSVIGFLVCGLTNDSMIVTGPTFWTILGLGMVINNMVKTGKTEGPVSFDVLPKRTIKK